MIPRTFCLSCRELKETRTNFTLEHFKENGLDVEVWYGNMGNKLGIKTSIPNDVDGFIKPRICSLIVNYLAIWEGLRHLPEDEFIIFEDDVLLCSNFKEEFKKSYESLPSDWEMVYLGGSCLEDKPREVINDRITQFRYPFGTFAILYKKSILEKLIVENSMLWMPIDVQLYYNSLSNVKQYSFIPQLVSTRTDWPSSLWEGWIN